MPPSRRPIDPQQINAFVEAWAAAIGPFIPVTVAQLVQMCVERGLLARLLDGGDADVRLGILLARLANQEAAGRMIRLVSADRHSKCRYYAIRNVVEDVVGSDATPAAGADVAAFPDW